MTSQQFILWLRGFTEGVHDFNITPKQWDILKEKLAEVSDNVIPMGSLLTDPNPLKTVYPNWTGINPYGTTYTPGFAVTTSTATSLPSGSTISYTTSNDKTLLND